jgi:hypothetical protein
MTGLGGEQEAVVISATDTWYQVPRDTQVRKEAGTTLSTDTYSKYSSKWSSK